MRFYQQNFQSATVNTFSYFRLLSLNTVSLEFLHPRKNYCISILLRNIHLIILNFAISLVSESTLKEGFHIFYSLECSNNFILLNGEARLIPSKKALEHEKKLFCMRTFPSSYLYFALISVFSELRQCKIL